MLTVAFALGRCRIWLREMIKPHNGDEARMQAAEAIVRQIEQSNFRVGCVPPKPPHSTPGPTMHDSFRYQHDPSGNHSPDGRD